MRADTTGLRRWLARQRYLIDYAVGAMARHKGRHLGLLMVYALLVFALSSVLLMADALRREASAMLAEGPDVVLQGLRAGRHHMSRQSDVDKLQGLRGVHQAEGRLWGYLFDTSTGANYTLQVPGSLAPEYQPAAGRVFIGEGVARLRKLRVGQRLFLVSPAGDFLNLEVQGLLPAESALVSSDLVLLSAADFRRFYRLADDEFTDLVLRVRNPKEVAKVAEKSGLLLRQHRVIARADMQRTYEAIFSWREGMLLAMLGSSLLAFAILAFDKASGLSAQERRDIGILKAVGWNTGDILRMKLWEAAVIAVSAFGIGFGAAYVNVFVFSAPWLEAALAGWSTLYPRVALAPGLDSLQVATLALISVLPYLAAIVVPVWRTAAADPDAVMR